MSKYRIKITYSPYRCLIANACLIACMGFVLGSLSPALWTWFAPPIAVLAWVGVSLLLVCKGVMRVRFETHHPFQFSILLSSNGELRQSTPSSSLKPKYDERWDRDTSSCDTTMQLHPTSQLFPWGICIAVVKVKSRWFDRNYAHWGWILKNECSEADYRRLCRAVNFVRKGTHRI